MFTAELANLILVPYLWWGGYVMDDESIAICRHQIALQVDEGWPHDSVYFVAYAKPIRPED